MKNYYKYLFSNIKYLGLTFLGVLLVNINYFLIFKTIEFNALFVFMLISGALLPILFLTSQDLKNYRIIKKVLPLNLDELKNIFKYLFFLVLFISFFGGIALMIANVIITFLILLSIRDFFVKKYGNLFSSLILFLSNFSYLFILTGLDINKIIGDYIIVIYLLILLLVPLVLVLIYLITKLKIKSTLTINYRYKNKDKSIKLTVNGLFTYEDFANYMVNLKHSEISLSYDNVGIITYDNQDLLVYNVHTRKCFIYYISNTSYLYDLVKDKPNELGLTILVNRVKRAESLFKRYNGEISSDFKTEYEFYDITAEQESKWVK